MSLRAVCLSVLILFAAGCARERVAESPSQEHPALVLREVLDDPEGAAISLPFEDEALALGEARRFAVASAVPNGNGVLITLVEDDAAALAAYSEGLVGRRVAVVQDGEVVTAAVVQSVLGTGQIQLMGSFADPQRNQELVARWLAAWSRDA